MRQALTETPAWQALVAHHRESRELTLRELFARDAERGRRFAGEAAGLYFDYSKNRITDETLELLVALADERGVAERTQAMFDGQHINTTEDRAVMHVALRAAKGAHLYVDGHDVVPDVHQVLDRMGHFARDVRDGGWKGFDGSRIRHIINIGIGGSDLGPAMAYEALRPYATRELDVRFVSNVDPADFTGAVEGCDARETLFIISSKTFTTLETMTNAQLARQYCLAALGDERAVARHFVAVSTNAQAVRAFGIETDNMFGFWDWVGGRYSMDSAIGLSTMIAIGPERFAEMLSGMRAMDEHFREQPLKSNLPVLHGLISLWYNNFYGAQTTAVLPYSQALRRFPAYLQQLTMESNGKSVTLAGEPLAVSSAPVLFGEPGTNGQHSFYELLHQGTVLVPCDFIGFSRSSTTQASQHELLVANVLAQSEALAMGRTPEEVRAAGVAENLVAHRSYSGNRPSNTLWARQLDPATLGALIAFYEHSVFTQGTVWDINSFDQWGVELGKTLAQQVAADLARHDSAGAHDSSTRTLMERYRRER